MNMSPPDIRTCFISLALLLLSLLLSPSLVAQDLLYHFDRDFGGSVWEDLNSVEQTADDGYILGGHSSSPQDIPNVSETSRGNLDFWLVKLDEDGNKQWDKRYGGSEIERLFSVKQTTDGGYILGGWSASNANGDKTGANRGLFDYWLVKTDAAGVMQWDSTYGGGHLDYLFSVVETNDGYILAGQSWSDAGFEKTENSRGDFDVWIIKVDFNGTKIWDRTYGGNNEEQLSEVQIDVTDGNILVGGSTRSVVGDEIADPQIGGNTFADFWFFKIDATNGDMMWSERIGGEGEEKINSFNQTADGGYILGGGSRSDIYPPYKSENNRGDDDLWVIKLAADRSVEWDRTLGGALKDNCYSVKQNSIGNYMVGGFAYSGVGFEKTEPSRGFADYYLVYLDGNGNVKWSKTLGGDREDVLENLFQTRDGGYFFAGHSQSGISGDKVTPNNGLNDYWVIKTLCNISVEFQDTIVCPMADVELNALDTNCIQCTWDWSDDLLVKDSIRIINPSAPNTYNVTLTDGVGCSWTDDIEVDIYPTPTINLGPDINLCDGDTATLDAANLAFGYVWSTLQAGPVIEVTNSDIYTVTVTNSNLCTFTDTIDVEFHPYPDVNLGIDTSFCEGETITLDAGVQDVGTTYLWSHNSDVTQTQDISTAGVYVVSVNSQNNCLSHDTLQVIEVFSAPEIVNVVTNCNQNNTAYTVSFEIMGGQPSTYDVLGDAGILIGNSFTSDEIPKGGAFNFMVEDANLCDRDSIAGDYDCDCLTDAGALNTTPISVCGDEVITLNHFGGSLDFDDRLQFILHDGTGIPLGTELSRSDVPQFSYDASLTYGTSYFISAVSGNANASLNVDLADGCLDVSAPVEIVFYDFPTAVIVDVDGLQITCGQPDLTFDATSSQPFGAVDFFWESFDGGNIVGQANEPMVEVDTSGMYQLVVIDQVSGCRDTSQVDVGADEGVPNVTVNEPQVFTCQDTLIPLSGIGSSAGLNFNYLWEGGNVDSLTDIQVVANSPGTYFFSINNTDNGCTVTEEIIILADTDGPIMDAGATVQLDCLDEFVILEGEVDPSCVNCAFEWTTSDGSILSGENLIESIAISIGTYQLEITNLDNGCKNSDVVEVTRDEDTPQNPEFDIDSPICYGDNDGRIEVVSMEGGEAPYMYSLNGSPFVSFNYFEFLSPGFYDIAVQDAKGCDYDTTVYIPAAEEFTIDIGEDVEIELGDSVFINALSNMVIDTFFWTPEELLNCVDCLNPIAKPTTQSSIKFRAINEAGCVAIDYLNMFVRKDLNVYIPNVFSPNGDGINDTFTIFAGNSVEEIKEFKIFDRWGELLYTRENIQPNNIPDGWNGLLKGKELQNGVYIYFAEIIFVDGSSELMEGSFTMLR